MVSADNYIRKVLIANGIGDIIVGLVLIFASNQLADLLGFSSSIELTYTNGGWGVAALARPQLLISYCIIVLVLETEPKSKNPTFRNIEATDANSRIILSSAGPTRVALNDLARALKADNLNLNRVGKYRPPDDQLKSWIEAFPSSQDSSNMDENKSGWQDMTDSNDQDVLDALRRKPNSLLNKLLTNVTASSHRYKFKYEALKILSSRTVKR